MRRLLALLGAMLVLFVLGGPALAHQDDAAPTGRVLISIDGNLTLPAGEQADAVIVVRGDALIEGEASTVTVVGGEAILRDAMVQSLIIVDGTAWLEEGTTVGGDVLQLNAIVERAEGVIVGGEIRPLIQDLAALGLFVGAAAVALWIGAVLALLVAGLTLAGLAARQVRSAERIISGEPLKAFLVGLAMVFLPPVVLILLAATVVGLPLALSLLFIVWPALAFVGYIVAAIWLGERLLRAAGRREETERPYLAAVVGLVVAGLLTLVPLVGAVISVFGLGAVTVAGWRMLVGGPPTKQVLQPYAAPIAG
jgi:hypothetical protein